MVDILKELRETESSTAVKKAEQLFAKKRCNRKLDRVESNKMRVAVPGALHVKNLVAFVFMLKC